MDKNQILEQLKQINYPGFNRDVVSFGMVKEVVIDKNIVTIILAISSSNEEKKNQLVQEISDKLKTDNYELKIKVLDQPTRKTVDTSNKDANVEGNIKNIIAVIGSHDSEASIKIHKKNGFEMIGTIKKVGYKQGKWLDTIYMQRILNEKN